MRSIRFHADWEKRVLGVTLAAGALGYWNIDASRHVRESLPPAIYYNASYYEIWLRGLEILLQRAGEVSAEELATGKAQAPGHRSDRRLPPTKSPLSWRKAVPPTAPVPRRASNRATACGR
jgi:hypothetical protein